MKNSSKQKLTLRFFWWIPKIKTYYGHFGIYHNFVQGLSEANEYSKESVERVVKASFLHMDEILRDQLRLKGDRSGTTCTCLLITPQHYFFINCGDSRGLIVRDSKVLFFTHDHKPTNEEERDRIIAAGGIVMNLRINGSLAVSKALGDFDYK